MLSDATYAAVKIFWRKHRLNRRRTLKAKRAKKAEREAIKKQIKKAKELASLAARQVANKAKRAAKKAAEETAKKNKDEEMANNVFIAQPGCAPPQGAAPAPAVGFVPAQYYQPHLAPPAAYYANPAAYTVSPPFTTVPQPVTGFVNGPAATLMPATMMAGATAPGAAPLGMGPGPAGMPVPVNMPAHVPTVTGGGPAGWAPGYGYRYPPGYNYGGIQNPAVQQPWYGGPIWDPHQPMPAGQFYAQGGRKPFH